MGLSVFKSVPKRPSISLSDDENYRKDEDRLTELKSRASALERQREAMAYSIGTVSPKGRDIDRRAAALLESGQVVESEGASQDRLRDELSDVVDELRVAVRAVEMQKRIVESER